MTQLFMRYLGAALPASVLIALLALARPWLQRRYRARLLSLLWLVPAVLLLLPVQLRLPRQTAPVQLQLPQTAYVVAVDEQKLPQLAAPQLPQPPGETGIQEDYRQQLQDYRQAVTVYEQTVDAARRQAGHTVTLPQVLCALWLAGAAALALWQLAACVYEQNRLLKNAVLVTEDVPVGALCAELGIRQRITVHRSAAAHTPLVLGLLRPRLVLPAEEYTPAVLEMICRHELQHIRRGDILRKLIMNLAVLVHWYDPLVWLARRLAAQDAELACDEAVLENRSADYRAAYAQSILKAAAAAANKHQPLFSTGFACGKKTLKQRFAAICSTAAKYPGRAVLCAVLCLALLGGGIVAVTAGTAEGEKPFSFADKDKTDAGALTAEQLAALEQTRFWRTAFYRDPKWLAKWSLEQTGIDLSVGTEIWSTSMVGEKFRWYRTGLAWVTVEDAQCAAMGPALAKEMQRYAFEVKALHCVTPFDWPAGKTSTWEDWVVAVSPVWLETAGLIEQTALPALHITQMTEDAIFLEIEPEWWEVHAEQPSVVQLSRMEDGRWLVTEWSVPPVEDCWCDPSRPDLETKKLGTWENLTYAFVQGNLQCTDENGDLQWIQPVFSSTVEEWFYLPRLEMTGSDLFFFAAGQRVGCVRPNGEIFLSAVSSVLGETLDWDHSVYGGRYVTLTLQTDASPVPLQARFDSFLMEWTWLDENGVATDGSDLWTTFGTAGDGLTELRAVNTPEGVSGLVLKDVRHSTGRYLGPFAWGTFLPDDSILAWTADRLCSFSAADGYAYPLEWTLPPQAGELLHAVYDASADSYLLIFAEGPTGQRVYSIVHCRHGGGVERIVSTGIPFTENHLHFFTMQDGLLTVRADDTVNLTGESLAHFVYDPAAQTVTDLSGEG
ncbi:MAG: M56 family metallopeptidase [Oscillospiraceae bacterium]|nr:M56 family metallopeptidase [Oscillospiraceae bacterium]